MDLLALQTRIEESGRFRLDSVTRRGDNPRCLHLFITDKVWARPRHTEEIPISLDKSIEEIATVVEEHCNARLKQIATFYKEYGESLSRTFG